MYYIISKFGQGKNQQTFKYQDEEAYLLISQSSRTTSNLAAGTSNSFSLTIEGQEFTRSTDEIYHSSIITKKEFNKIKTQIVEEINQDKAKIENPNNFYNYEEIESLGNPAKYKARVGQLLNGNFTPIQQFGGWKQCAGFIKNQDIHSFSQPFNITSTQDIITSLLFKTSSTCHTDDNELNESAGEVKKALNELSQAIKKKTLFEEENKEKEKLSGLKIASFFTVVLAATAAALTVAALLGAVSVIIPACFLGATIIGSVIDYKSYKSYQKACLEYNDKWDSLADQKNGGQNKPVIQSTLSCPKKVIIPTYNTSLDNPGEFKALF